MDLPANVCRVYHIIKLLTILVTLNCYAHEEICFHHKRMSTKSLSLLLAIDPLIDLYRKQSSSLNTWLNPVSVTKRERQKMKKTETAEKRDPLRPHAREATATKRL